LNIRPCRVAYCRPVICTVQSSCTLSTEPEIHDVSQRRHRRTKPRSQATCTEHYVNFEHDFFVFEMCCQTGRPRLTHQSQCFASLSGIPERSYYVQYTDKNIRIFTDILWRVLHILTEPVPYTLVSANRRNNAQPGSTLQRS